MTGGKLKGIRKEIQAEGVISYLIFFLKNSVIDEKIIKRKVNPQN